MDGENGLLFTPNDPDELARKIAHLVDDRRSCDQMRYAGRRTILEQFTMTKMMDEIENYLQEVASVPTAQTTGPLEPIQNAG